MARDKRRDQREKRRQAAEQSHKHGPIADITRPETKQNQVQEARSELAKDECEAQVDMAAKARIGEWIGNNSNSVIAIFTVVIAVFAGLQWRIFNAQLTEMRIDQRPWVNMQVTGLNASVNGTMYVPMKVIDTGKTPALQLDGWVVVTAKPAGTPIDFRDPTKIKPSDVPKGEHMPYNEISIPVLFPQDPMLFSTARLLRTDDSGPHEETWTQAMQDAYAKGDIYVEIHGEVPYRDAAHTKHWTRFCSTFFKTKPLAEAITRSCDAYIDVDSNPK